MGTNPIDGFTVDPKDIQYIGHDLQRPECILAERDGTLWSADARGGVVRIAPDGSQTIITQSHQAAFAGNADAAKKFTEGTLPNGLAFAENGDLLIANFGTDCLEVMTRDGETMACESSPTVSRSPTKSASTPRRSGCTSSRPAASASRACASAPTDRSAVKRCSGLPPWAPQVFPTVSRSTHSATCGAP